MDTTDSVGGWGEVGDTFHMTYRGNSEIDRHYSKPMLPWIISEIKNRHKAVQVTVVITRGNITMRDTSGVVLLNHTVKQIHKCVMEQADHTCFLYTLKPSDKDLGLVSGAPGYVAASDPTVPVPANFSVDQNYQCHLLQAENEQEVRNFFTCLRQQPREVQNSQESSSVNSLNSLPDLYVHNESQFFEVLFVGRVKVSHSKVPPSFIDEAIAAFKVRERTRQRHASGGESGNIQPNSAAIAYQQEGSGLSVPNIVFSSFCDSDIEPRSRSNSRELGKILLPSTQGKEKDQENKEPHKAAKVRFSLWGNVDQPPQSSTEPSCKTPPTSGHESLPAVEMVTYRSTSLNAETEAAASQRFENQDKESTSESDETFAPELSVVEPFRQRLRTISGDSSQLFRRAPTAPEQGMRARAGSIGSITAKPRGIRYNDCDLRMLSHDFNRTMLFHIGRSEIQLINPEVKSVQLNKHFRDIAHCCQGVKQNDHFGFICREISGDTPCYLGYVFKCQISSVTDEIMQALSKAFAAVHEAQLRERQENLLCDHCPMRWFSQLCAEVEGMPAAKAHTVIMKRLNSLPEEDRTTLIAKYEGAEVSDTQAQNNILMMLLRAHFECKQSSHTHTALPGGGVKPDFHIGANFESSIRRAKKSLATSFNQLLKREGRESESAEREGSPAEDHSSSSSGSGSGEKHHTSTTTPPKVRMEGLSDSPLGQRHRPRSSTVSSSGGDSMRREFLAKRAAAKQKMIAEKAAKESAPVSPKRNIFMKVGSSSSRTEEEHSSDGKSSSKSSSSTSFRHAILQRVVSPCNKTEGQDQSRGQVERPLGKRPIAQLKVIWKKAIFQQILLNRMEKESQRIRAYQQEVALLRVRLNYEEEDLPREAVQAWELMLSRPHVRIDSNILHSGVKQGVPKAVRGNVWELLIHQHIARNPKALPQVPNYNTPFDSMIKDLTSQHHAILIDLGRTFPTHPYFMQTLGPGQLALFNVLKAYSLLDSDVGYCQGLSFVGGILLLHAEDEIAYSLLKHLMYVMGCRRQYRPDFIGLQVQMYQLSRLLHDQLRKLYDHLENHEVTPQLFAAPWFLTMFASQFPLNFVVRVFDLLFLEGMEAIFRIALVLLRNHEEALLACDSFEQIMDYMKTTMPNVQLSQQGYIISQACEMSLSRELHAYEVEYHVLQEELALSPQKDADFKKLQEANRNLKRQNLDLLEQLHHSNSQQHALETSNQSLQQSQHHLEVRVRWLELERGNLKQLVSLLSQKVSPEGLAEIPPNLQRFLPTDALKTEKKENLELKITESEDRESSRESDDISSSLPTSDFLLAHQGHQTRTMSMDYGSMQRYIKHLVHND
ncbi:TBC1 domain family member 1 isoform X1 [Penaeus vannamei]|uniref:TBC1 domain family member 1 isoform X1 n=1 Tax=Penaeus vannamei TaxID=6689 RepID=UPI000F65EF31|nr:TBC1 domain family member 1-like isoform X1 [Penaeus vannamei]